MRHGNKRMSRAKAIYSSPIFLVFMLVALIVLARAVNKIGDKADISEQRLAEARASLAKLGNREQSLDAEISKLSTEEGLQAELREKYRAVRPGESVAVVIDRNKTSTSADIESSAAASSSSKRGWFRGMLHWLGL